MQEVNSFRRLFWLAACLAMGCAGSIASGQKPAGGKVQRSTFTVTVAEDQSGHPLQGAKVFILSEGGKILSEGVTDANGEAVIRKPDRSERPAFLLAEKEWYFLGGVRWDQGFDERLIHLAPLAVT
jgi:hypothetical protein